jgi:hypothetical protein
MAGSSFGESKFSSKQLKQLKIDKQFVMEQEIKKIKKLMGVKSKTKKVPANLSFLTKGIKVDCDEVVVDVDIDINVDNNDDEFEVPEAYCESRWTDGSCRTYGEDQAGEMSPYCDQRWLDGTCRSYGADQAGTCYPKCDTRWSDGTCREWGADICG